MERSSLLRHMHEPAEMEQQENIFAEFVGMPVKVPYRDGPHFKIARGVLEDAESGFVKIRGPLGVIVINEKNIERMSLLSTR